jgi:signal transduction histidine kinase
MRSLTLKLTLAFLIVGLIGVALVAALVGRQTRRQFGEFVIDRYQADVLAEAADYYASTGSWEGFQASLKPRRGQWGQSGQGPGGGDGQSPPIALYDANSQLVFAGNTYGPMANAPAILQGDAGALPVEVEGEVVGYIQFAERPGMNTVDESPEARFLLAVDRAILLSAGAAALLALVLGVILARTISHPVQELTAATQVLAGGDLGHQVPVRTNDEIGELAKSFNRMSADLAHSNQLRRQMTADIAHDLRTPLSVITGYSEALADGKLPGTPETFEAMYIQTQHLNRLIEDLRTLSLADAGQLSLMRRPIEPRGLLEHTALAYLPVAESRGVALTVEGADAPPILVDPDRLLQVLGNLVNNALRHTGDGGRIDLSAARSNGQVLLRVRDTGPGIPDEDLPHIFDRFYRGDKARTTDGASGLGLAIARSLVEAHGGRITAENASGGGAQFTISLPLSTTPNPT